MRLAYTRRLCNFDSRFSRQRCAGCVFFVACFFFRRDLEDLRSSILQNRTIFFHKMSREKQPEACMRQGAWNSNGNDAGFARVTKSPTCKRAQFYSPLEVPQVAGNFCLDNTFETASKLKMKGFTLESDICWRHDSKDVFFSFQLFSWPQLGHWGSEPSLDSHAGGTASNNEWLAMGALGSN